MHKFLIVALLLASGGWTLRAGEITGKVDAVGAHDNGDAVVFVRPIAGKQFPAPKQHAVMDQKNLTFVPHVLPVLAGTTVDFLNSDDVAHNVYSPDACAGEFNLGSWSKGEKRSHTFTEAGCKAVILCNVHPEMEAWIVVVGTPYVAVSGKDGSYAIPDVPAGTYTLDVWHERLKGSPVTIEVPAKGTVSANFKLHR